MTDLENLFDCLWSGGCNGFDLLWRLYCFYLRWALAVVIASYVPATALVLMSLLPDYKTTWPRGRVAEAGGARRIVAGSRFYALVQTDDAVCFCQTSIEL